MQIPYNKPYLSGNELAYIKETIERGHISGDGIFTKKCHEFFETKYNFKKCLLTTSCTDALEMCAILLDIKENDEIIAPSYTFVSTVNAFVLRGAKIIFADSEKNTPNIDVEQIENLISANTKAILVVHYAGIACDMDKIMELAEKYNLYVVEDSAQAIDSFYLGKNGKKPLGSMGHLSAFSFHETKNIIAGEGGMLVINDEKFIQRAEIIREKGTNRSAFFRGEVNKYGWVDVGSSFLPSDMIGAFLFAQLENLEKIQKRRLEIWENYYQKLEILEKQNKILLPKIPNYATNNAHIFYIICRNLEERTNLIAHLKSKNIMAVFHYLSLHQSDFYKEKHNNISNHRELPQSDFYTDCLLRLPFYYELDAEKQDFVIEEIKKFYT